MNDLVKVVRIQSTCASAYVHYISKGKCERQQPESQVAHYVEGEEQSGQGVGRRHMLCYKGRSVARIM